MRYEGRIFRPPSEGRSYILQATIGCKHNVCAFCDMYKEKQFRVRRLEDIFEDIEQAKQAGYRPRRVFIADGDALSIDAPVLKQILERIQDTFKSCERIGIYATAQDIIEKGQDQMKMLAQNGLGIVYIGLESGSNAILKKMRKGVRAEQMIEAAQIAKSAGVKVSVTAISGLGGRAYWKEHAVETGKVLSAMNPDYIGLLTLMLGSGTQVYKWVQEGDFEILKPEEVLAETKLLVEQLDVTACVFRSNHASNYVNLSAQLPNEKSQVLSQLDQAIRAQSFKPEGHRML